MTIEGAIDLGYRKAIGLDSDVPQDVADSGAPYILAALESAGYVIVPKVPTEAMLDAATDFDWGPGNGDHTDATPKGVWAAMLEAAQ